jgi:hypothetical protein
VLVQLDGSDHDWFEGRAPRCVLLLFIDDATSRILYAEFIPVEDTLNLLRVTRSYLLRHGRPASFYVDKDSIYKINRQATVEEQLRDEQPLTQFTRAMKELDIEVIAAHSPQAKGRVERSFKTHQDRLVKELRLREISTPHEANAFLWKTYIPEHNARFAVEPASPANAHRSLLKSHRLDEILSVRSERTLLNDFTLRFQNQFFQILPEQSIRVWMVPRICASRISTSASRPFPKGLTNPPTKGTISLRRSLALRSPTNRPRTILGEDGLLKNRRSPLMSTSRRL